MNHASHGNNAFTMLKNCLNRNRSKRPTCNFGRLECPNGTAVKDGKLRRGCRGHTVQTWAAHTWHLRCAYSGGDASYDFVRNACASQTALNARARFCTLSGPPLTSLIIANGHVMSRNDDACSFQDQLDCLHVLHVAHSLQGIPDLCSARQVWGRRSHTIPKVCSHYRADATSSARSFCRGTVLPSVPRWPGLSLHVAWLTFTAPVVWLCVPELVAHSLPATVANTASGVWNLQT